MKTNPGKSAATTAPARRKYDEEFKRQALQMIHDGQPVRSVAQALGIGVIVGWPALLSPTPSR